MSFFENTFQMLSAYKTLDSCIQNNMSPVSLTGLSIVHKAQLALVLAQKTGKPVLIISPDENEARRICSDINTMCPSETSQAAALFPARELVLAPVEGISGEFVCGRLAALSDVINGSCKVVSASIEAVMQPVIPKVQLENISLSLSVGKTIELMEFTRKLLNMGYVRADTVEGQGQFAVRGAIVDVFPPQAVNPIRIELWGDEIDTVSEFSTESQRRITSLAEVIIPPAKEVICDYLSLSEKINVLADSLRGKHAVAVREHLKNDSDALRDGLSLSNIDKYIPIIYEKLPLIFEYDFGCIIFSEFSGSVGTANNISNRYQEDIKIMLEEETICSKLTGHMAELPVIQNEAEKCGFCIYASNFLQSGEHVNFKKLISMDAFQSAPWGGEMRQLTEDLQEMCEMSYCVMLAAGSEKTLPIIKSDLEKNGFSCSITNDDSVWKKGHIYLMTGSFSSGFSYPEIKTALITQAKALRSKSRKPKAAPGKELRSLADLSKGDLVVHALHGI